MKRCPKCSTPKEESEFYPSKQTKDGLRGLCKECEKKANKLREPSYNQKRKEYRLNHKEESRLKKKDYYNNNKEHILNMNSKWRQTINGRLLSYKRAALARNIDWSLTEEEFSKFWRVPCYYCDSPIETIGLDRVDNSIGYISTNVVPCCSVCNTMKLDLSIEQFINQIKLIYEKRYIQRG